MKKMMRMMIFFKKYISSEKERKIIMKELIHYKINN